MLPDKSDYGINFQISDTCYQFQIVKYFVAIYTFIITKMNLNKWSSTPTFYPLDHTRFYPTQVNNNTFDMMSIPIEYTFLAFTSILSSK